MVLPRLILVLSLFSLGAVSFMSIGKIVTGTPAFSKSVRQFGLYGDWRVQGHWAMYHQAKYLRELGIGFLRADQSVSGVTEGPDEIADPDLALERAAVAAAFFKKSLRLSPGQAVAWTSLAWAEALQGNLKEARSALETSWKIAPYNVSQAGARLTLADLLSDLDETGTLFDEFTDKGVLDDLRTIKRYRGAQFRNTLAVFERYQALASREALTP